MTLQISAPCCNFLHIMFTTDNMKYNNLYSGLFIWHSLNYTDGRTYPVYIKADEPNDGIVLYHIHGPKRFVLKPKWDVAIDT